MFLVTKSLEFLYSGFFVIMRLNSKDRTGSYHALVVLKRYRSATRLDNL
nr:MAG TPA: hypothetical protein [Caudoviricetes sp.]